MQAIIHGERETADGESRVGITVTDNNGIEHGIEIDVHGVVHKHGQDGYPDDPSKRTQEGNEHVNQARQYARWHVYRERGYETLPRYENPDCIVGAMLAIGATPRSRIEELFGDLLHAIRTHAGGGHVDIPTDGVSQNDVIVYRQHIYVDPDPLDQDEPLVDQFVDYFSDPPHTLEQILGPETGSLDRLVEVFEGNTEPAVSLPEFDIEAVSDISYLYSDGGEERHSQPPDSVERSPDARLELMPLDIDVFPSEKYFLFSHLGNQVRDRYLLMGRDPPGPFQQQGLGTYTGMKRQQSLDLYDEHFLAESTDRPI